MELNEERGFKGIKDYPLKKKVTEKEQLNTKEWNVKLYFNKAVEDIETDLFFFLLVRLKKNYKQLKFTNSICNTY